MPRWQSRFAILMLSWLMLAGSAQAQTPQSDVVLKVGVFGGPFIDTMRRYTTDLFTKRTGIKVEMTAGNPSDFLAQLIASRGREPPFDVVCLDDDVTADAIHAGVVQKLDPAQVPYLKFLYPEALNKDGYGPAFLFYALGIVFNHAKLQEAGIPDPKTWADLWDPRLVGHVSVPDIANIQGRDFILQVARLNGGSEKAPEVALQKIAEIKAASYYTASATLQAQLAAGDVWVSVWNNMRAGSMASAGLPIGFVIPAEGSIGNTDTVGLVTGTKHPKEAHQLINAMLDPFSQIALVNTLPNSPTNTLIVPVINAAYPDLVKYAPTTPEELKKLYLPDWGVFNGNLRKVTDAWNRLVKQ